MAAIAILERSHGPVTVLRLQGSVQDAGTMVRLAHGLLDARIDGGHVVLDLDGLRIEDPSALCAFFARLGGTTGGVPVPTVVGDPAVRRLVRDCGSGAAGLACFATVDEAATVARPTVLSA